MDLEAIIWKSHILRMYTCSPLWFAGLGEGEFFHRFIFFVSSFAQLYFLPFRLRHLPFSFPSLSAVGSARWHGCWPEPRSQDNGLCAAGTTTD